VALDERFGLRQPSWARCDEVTSLQRSRLTHLVGRVPDTKLREFNRALAVALDIEASDLM
jgi:mRNA-degrading endonuclease toxin of MazEF toxin-antitoxin module